jgi:hypothetical protein
MNENVTPSPAAAKTYRRTSLIPYKISPFAPFVKSYCSGLTEKKHPDCLFFDPHGQIVPLLNIIGQKNGHICPCI